jgi:type VI secretion system secreted protein Hcp
MKMAGNVFLHLEGIPGESLDEATSSGGGAKHTGQIEVKAWSWGTENHIHWDVNQGGQSTKTVVKAIDIEKTVDKASHRLYQACTNGLHIPHATLFARKNASGEEMMNYLKVHLTDVMVNEIIWEGQGDEAYTKERVKLSFAQFEISYNIQKDDGSPDPAGEHGWNVQKQTRA